MLVSKSYDFSLIIPYRTPSFISSFPSFHPTNYSNALYNELFGFCFRLASECIKYSKPNNPPLCFLFGGLFFLFRLLFLSLLNSRNRFIYSLLLLILLYLTVNCLLPNLTTFGFCNLSLIMYPFLIKRGILLLGVVFVLAISFIFQLRHQYYRLVLKQEQINLHHPVAYVSLFLSRNIFSR